MKAFFSKAQVSVFPGIAYCYVRFENEKDADEMLSNSKEVGDTYFLEVQERPVFMI